MEGKTKSSERIGQIIQEISYLIDTEELPTDFTRFRRMTERRGSLSEMSKQEAALIGAAIKVVLDLAKLQHPPPHTQRRSVSPQGKDASGDS
jgi:hypothetical protein